VPCSHSTEPEVSARPSACPLRKMLANQ